MSLEARLKRAEERCRPEALPVLFYHYGELPPVAEEGQQVVCQKMINPDGSVGVADEHRQPDGSYYNEDSQLVYHVEYCESAAARES